MRARRLIATLLPCLVLWSGLVHADDVLADVLAELRREQSELCPDVSRQAELVSQVLGHLEADDANLGLAREFLTLLVRTSGWRGTRGPEDVDRVWTLAERVGLTDAQLVNVVRQAHGHLLHILNQVAGPVHRLAALRALRDRVGGRNGLYDLYLGSSLAEQHEQLAFAGMEDAENVSISALQSAPEFENARGHLRAAEEGYRELRNAALDPQVEAQLQADFLFRTAMLQVLLGDAGWRDTVAEIGLSFSDWRDHYRDTRDAALDQVYVQRFVAFAPPPPPPTEPVSPATPQGRTSSEVADDGRKPKATATGASSPNGQVPLLDALVYAVEMQLTTTYGLVDGMIQDGVTGLEEAFAGPADESCVAVVAAAPQPAANAVRASLNPLHLARHLCDVATVGELDGWSFPLASFDNSMRRFENRDYRVVLLHRQDLDDAPEAEVLQQMLEAKLAPREEVVRAIDTTMDTACDVAALHEQTQGGGEMVQIAGEAAGDHLFIGGSLTYRTAAALVALMRDVELEDIELQPYAVRPRVDR